MEVAVQAVERGLAARAACADGRHLGVEGHELLVDQRRAAERRPGAVEIGRRAQHRLALAVVTHAPRLQHAGQADARDRARERRARIDRGVARRRDAEALEQALFRQAVLRGGQRAQRRRDARLLAAQRLAQRLDRDVLPVEADHPAAPRELGEQRRIGEFADERGRELRRRRVGAAVEEEEVQPQRIAGQGQHAAQLAGADDADRHLGAVRGSGWASTA